VPLITEERKGTEAASPLRLALWECVSLVTFFAQAKKVTRARRAWKPLKKTKPQKTKPKTQKKERPQKRGRPIIKPGKKTTQPSINQPTTS
jgi:hypothetical protein